MMGVSGSDRANILTFVEEYRMQTNAHGGVHGLR